MAPYYVDLNGNITTSPQTKKKKKKTEYYVDLEGNVSVREQELDDELSPDSPATKITEDDGKLDFFQKSKGNFVQSVLGTVADAGVNIVKGAQRLGEGIIDLGAYGVAGIADALGEDEWAKRLKNTVKESQTDFMWGGVSDYLDDYSVLGRTSDAVTEGIGQVGTIILTGGLAGAAGAGSAAATAITTGVTGLSGMGSGMSEAYKGGATDEEAVTYGVISGGADALTELLFGGLGKATGAIGLSKGLSSADDLLAKKASSMFKSQIAKNIVEFGVKASAEGIEEVIAGTAQAIGKYKTYMSEEEFGDILRDENLLEQFIVGAVTSGIAQSGIVPGMKSGSLIEANKAGTDFVTGYTQNEQAVIDKEVEKRIAEQEQDGTKLTKKQQGDIQKQVEAELDKGYISIDTIEEALGGETYSAYRDTVTKEDAQIEELEKQIKELEEAPNTVGNAKKYDALTAQLEDLKTNSKRDQLKKQLGDEVLGIAQGSRLAESYNEKARRSQTFEADLTKYDAKQQEIVQKAVDSGILNNTNRTHEFVDLIAKIAADKGVSFDFTNNAKLKESGFAVDGATVNGYVTKDGVTVNIQSAKALNSVVGHEITHVLEGTELYTELQNAVKQYAESKGEYKARMDAISKLYAGVKDADVNAELTADLVGDYLFTDADFVQKLSVEHRNVFQKIYDEIKYLAKIATAGSKQARQLEKAKKAFEDAYRAETKNTAKDGGVKYHISETFSEEIDKTLNNEMPKGSQVKARDYTPEILVENGVKDLPMLITQRHIKTTIYTEAEAKELGLPTDDKHHYHGLGKDLLMQSIDNMDNPLEIYRQDNDHYLIITEMKNSNGDSIIIPVKIDGKGTYNDVYIDENQIKSVYGKKSLEDYLSRNNFELIYAKKSTALNEGVQFPNISGASQQIDKRSASEDIVPQNSEKSSGNSDVQRSLSNEGDIAPAYGNYNVYGKDIALEGVPIRDDLAPVQDSVQPTVQESDFAPTTEAEANALADETLWQMTDEDAPPVQEAYNDDFTDTTAIEPKALKDISKALKDVLYLDNKEVAAIGEVVQKYSTSEFPDKLDLFEELQAKFGTKETVERNDETAAIKRVLRGYPINVSPEIKSDITDYTAFMRRNFGKVRFSKEGVPVDAAYQDLSDMFPEYFPDDITNASDQLIRISEVAGMDINETETFTLSDGDIMEAVDVITAEVAKYKESQVQAAVEAEAQAAFAQIEDIPIREDITPAAVTPAESVATEDKPIKTVKDRLSAKLQNFQTELAANQQNRAASAASFDLAISRLYAEYSGKKNKDTKAANDILRRIDRLRTRKGNVDADYAKRINDLEARVEKTAEEVRTGASATEQAAMRREVHTAIVDNIKTTYGERGYDFDKVLENAKDLSTFSTVDNIPQRVMEKALGYKEGQILADLTVNKVAQNETEGIKWLNSFTDRKSGLLAQISKQYGIKPGSKESAAAQMYAEGFYVNDNEEIIQYGDAELAKDFPDATVRENIKGLAKDPRIRKIYDETLAAINESRARNAYPEIQRLDNYFLHFRAQTDTFSRLGIPFNPKDIKAKDLPTDLNGVTADLKPGQPYFASAMHRKGKRTSFDLLGGLEQYLTSAKDQIYHIDDIQTLRALRNYIADTYGQAKGLENLDTLTEEEAEAKIKEVYDSHLSTFAKFLNEEANVIAGKTSLTDRGIEGIIGRRGISFLDTINRQVGANMVGFNVSSSLTNFLAAVQGMAKTNKFDFVKAMAQTTANKLGSIVGKTDGFTEQSPVVIRRKGAERFHRTPWQKASDAGYVLMSAVDDISTEVVARAKYNELTRKGMDAQQAHVETDKWVSRLMGDRSLGQQPQLYNSKMLGMFTKFQLEVRNQLDSQFYDTIQEAKVSSEDIQNGLARNAVTAAKVGSTLFQLAVLQHLFGKAFESIAGYNPAFDIIDVLIKTFGWDDDEEDEDTALDNVQEGFLALMGDLPYTSTFTGGRIPIASALPIEQLVTGKDDYGNEKSRWDTVKEAAPYYVLPGGYSQIRKTTQGLSMFDDDLPIAGSYTDSGNLRFPVEDTPANRLQAGLFGQWASENARDYFDNERAPLKEKQIQEYVDLDLPISEYWKYREGLKGLETTEEKLQYIDSLDLPTAKKNIMANNVTDRENPIDMTDFDLYGSLDEFDFATKYPEKYAFFENSGITYAAYANGDEDAKRAYNWAYENPGKYTVSKAVAGDVVEYRRYISEINDLTADKDEYGESISGSAKDKKIEYINGLNLDYGQKVILFRSIYDGKADRATYDAGIVEYLNSREDISYEEKVTILKELDFTVLDDGTVRW